MSITFIRGINMTWKIRPWSCRGSIPAAAMTSTCSSGSMIIGKRKEEALRLAETFMGMIKGTATADQIENLEEAAALQDISHMPARVKCAVLGWRTMRQMLEEINK